MKNSLKHIDTLEKWNILSSAIIKRIIIDGKCNTTMIPRRIPAWFNNRASQM